MRTILLPFGLKPVQLQKYVKAGFNLPVSGEHKSTHRMSEDIHDVAGTYGQMYCRGVGYPETTIFCARTHTYIYTYIYMNICSVCTKKEKSRTNLEQPRPLGLSLC